MAEALAQLNLSAVAEQGLLLGIPCSTGQQAVALALVLLAYDCECGGGAGI